MNQLRANCLSRLCETEDPFVPQECEMGHLGHLDTQALKELARDLQCDVTNEQRRTELIQQIVEKEIPLDFPDSIDVASFLIFDVLEDTPDRVIEQLTRALATVGGDEMREMGFAQTEKERLTYAVRALQPFASMFGRALSERSLCVRCTSAWYNTVGALRALST